MGIALSMCYVTMNIEYEQWCMMNYPRVGNDCGSTHYISNWENISGSRISPSNILFKMIHETTQE